MSSRETKASMSIHIYIQTYLQRYTNRNVIVCCYTNYIIAKIYLNYRKAKQIGMELLILLFAALLTVPNVYFFLIFVRQRDSACLRNLINVTLSDVIITNLIILCVS